MNKIQTLSSQTVSFQQWGNKITSSFTLMNLSDNSNESTTDWYDFNAGWGNCFEVNQYFKLDVSVDVMIDVSGFIAGWANTLCEDEFFNLDIC